MQSVQQWYSEYFLSEFLENSSVFSMYRRVFLIKGSTVTDPTGSDLYYGPSVIAQGRWMRDGVFSSCQKFQNILRVHVLLWGNCMDFQYKTFCSNVLVGADNFFHTKQKDKWKQHFAVPLSVKVIFLLLLFFGYWVEKVNSGIWQLKSIDISSKMYSQISRR